MATEPISVRCFDSFAQARADAAGRLDDDAQPSPFDRIDWFENLQASAFPDCTPLIVTARQGEARAWLFLAREKRHVLSGLANWYSFQFRPQFFAAEDMATRLALLRAMATELRGAAPRLRFHPVIEDGSDDGALLGQAFGATGWRVVSRIMGRKRVIALPPLASFQDYWNARPGRLRSTFRRKSHRQPAVIAIHRDVDDQLWAAFEQVFKASWKPHGDDFAFLRAFARSEAQAGRLRLGLATLNGEAAAVELWTIDQRRAFIHKLAFDERFARASPGTQLSHAMFRHAIDDERVSAIDFGTGDNDYKAAWMPQTVAMRQIDAFDLRAPASWGPAMATWLSALSQPAAGGGQPEGKAQGGRRAALQATAKRDAR